MWVKTCTCSLPLQDCTTWIGGEWEMRVCMLHRHMMFRLILMFSFRTRNSLGMKLHERDIMEVFQSMQARPLIWSLACDTTLSSGNYTDTNARWTTWAAPLSQLLPPTLSCSGGCFCSPPAWGRTSSGSWPAHRLCCLQRSRSSTLAAFSRDSWSRQGWCIRGLLGWVCFSC